MDDTIAAIATTVGISAINIIKISGKDSIKIVNKIFSKDLTKVKANTITYGFIKDKDEIIDEVMVSVFLAPKSYTREDVVEINSHGGIVVTNKIFELVLENGARQAEGGEFLKRAFLNGRVDLSEAQAVEDLIEAKNEMARKLSIKNLNGDLSKKIHDMRDKLIKILSNIEVNIDYPEYEDALEITNDLITKDINYIEKEINKIIINSDKATTIKNGINVGIIGRPNVGKSSLLNTLIGENKAIVTDIEGTTRDIVEGTIIIDGLMLNLIDTAGIRKSNDIVEKIGINKSYETINKSDLILLLFDNNKEINEEEIELINNLNNKKEKVIIIINKIDLESKIDENYFKDFDVVKISIKDNNNIEKLKTKIKQKFELENINIDDFTYVSNAREIALLKKGLNIINNIKNAINNNVLIDMIEIDIKDLYDTLGEITGEVYKEELLDEMFKRFCLGK
jgi:tRNA modification GTPase